MQTIKITISSKKPTQVEITERKPKNKKSTAFRQLDILFSRMLSDPEKENGGDSL